MATVKRSNPDAFKKLQVALEGLDGLVGKSGWFGSSKYADGTPVASKANGAGLPVTKPHQIVIPPRPFMRPTIERMQKRWMELFAQGSRAALKGKTTGLDVMDSVVQNASAEIARSITLVTSPPLKASTIAARRRARADKKTVGLLTKPLIDSG